MMVRGQLEHWVLVVAVIGACCGVCGCACSNWCECDCWVVAVVGCESGVVGEACCADGAVSIGCN